ncbi:ABC transporter permease [Terrabacter sp. GCM10028922]|uniref:ABC transporter permease n=1 Tax=Terrabacter sp. GCM10028922 TaxID=3273428 RepID=UPI003623A999
MTTTTAPRTAGHAPRAVRASGLTGTATLLRLAARRDRVLIPVSVLALAGVVASSAQATIDLYPNPQGAIGAVRTALENPALVALYGPISSLTLDAFATFKTVLMGAVFLSLLAYVVVRRHTRTEEEEGRLELLGAGVVGRRAPLAAAVLLATGAVLATALLTTAAAVGVGLDRGGSVALGVAWLTIGLTWVGVTAVAAQLTETARGTAGFALGALGVAYLLRAVGDTAAAGSPLRALTWLSPLGWGEKVSAYGENRLWVLALGVVAYAGLVLAAFALLERRDLGSGVLPSRPGPARGGLSSVEGLTLRLARGTLVGWLVAFVLLGGLVGSMAGNVQDFVDSPETAEMLRKLGGGGGTIVDTFFATEIHVAAVAASALGIALVTRMRSEEGSGRLEPLLASPVGRLRWALAHLGLALAATTCVMVALGLVAGVVDGRRTGDVVGTVGALAGAAISTLPATWVCVALAVLLVGALPRLTGLAWAALIVFLVLGELGALMGLPTWLTAISPFDHLPALPGGTLDVLPLVVLVVVAAVVAGLGLTALRRRDIPA